MAAVLLAGSLGLAALPKSAEAGLLEVLVRLFGGRPGDVEEAAGPPVRLFESAFIGSAIGAEHRAPIWPDALRAGTPLAFVHGDSLVAPLNPLGTLPSTPPEVAGRIFVYTVRPGDTIAGIAQSFEVSINTIMWANNIRDARAVAVGDQLIILPVTGVRHEVKPGDTISSLAKKYRAAIEDILQFNGLAPDEELLAGAIVTVPDGELPGAAALSAATLAGLPGYEGYYERPIAGGRRSRGLHGFNGVDLAASCGLPVMAAADGEVLLARSDGWNGGYGRYVVITHANSTQTLYGHLKDALVGPAALVRQGQLIGTIGSSGNSTGCHVHFEVRGARNPF